MVMLTIGPGRRDATCAKNGFSLPHVIVGSGPVGYVQNPTFYVHANMIEKNGLLAMCNTQNLYTLDSTLRGLLLLINSRPS